MPTHKQILKRHDEIAHLYDQLNEALCAAYNAGMLVYKDYDSQSPCKALKESRKRLHSAAGMAMFELVEKSKKPIP